MNHRLLLVLLLCFSPAVFAIDAVEFTDQAHRERFQALTFELRCPKCQNQNLTDSNSQISIDLRREVARLIQEGKSDQEIKSHMVALYGDFILYKPPIQTNTLVLWAGPVVMVLIGLMIFGFIIIRRARLAATEGDEEILTDSNGNEISAVYDETSRR